MSRFLIMLLCVFLAGCASAKDEFAKHGFERKVSVPKYPVILIHGLGYTGKYWEKSGMLKELKKLGWDYGGDLKVRNTSDGIFVEPVLIRPAHLYAMTFSYTQLAIVQQGKELAEIIRRVKEANRSDKVILIGHSMGGLAAREYLQSTYYQHDVDCFISLGTPHAGSAFSLQKVSLKLIPKPVRDIVWNIDEKTDAVRDLRPKSIYLSGGPEMKSPDEYRSKDINLNGRITDEIIGLNDFANHPLPMDVRYVAIIGSGCPILSTRTQCSMSDGIVKINSQDLNRIPGCNVKAEVLTTDKDHFGEANDSWVLMKALDQELVCVG